MPTPPHWETQRFRLNPYAEICPSCGEFIIPPRDLCPACRKDTLPEGVKHLPDGKSTSLDKHLLDGKPSPENVVTCSFERGRRK